MIFPYAPALVSHSPLQVIIAQSLKICMEEWKDTFTGSQAFSELFPALHASMAPKILSASA